ncbi:SRPBCC family protein [Microbispora cellulosiformans]|uniref:SRPBCC family protein n=1 Tax=Microbispora cellulosiformans TaxID=2614688 RepID=A0A5J5JRL1_9ACTN|nr:SRPBCC family protein [Microbispora cellulosiformans]KAA9373699.1 SRPBCC family protein [Microbispora cellulosiformans]
MTEETRERARESEETALPTERLGQEVQNLLTAAAERALSGVAGRVDRMAGRLTEYVDQGGSGLFDAVTGRQRNGGPGVLGNLTERLTGGQGGQGLLRSLADRLGATGGGGLLGTLTEALTEGGGGGGSHPVRAALFAYGKEKIKGLFGGGGGKGKGRKGKKLKLTNIVESLDVGAPIRVVYNQWTQFEDWPGFMKKVETVEQKSDEKLAWKAQVWWSHRTWESTIVEQVPDSRIVWRSQGPKGWPDGSVTFHEVTPEMTRVLLVIEYNPQGLFERIGNLWRAQGRRVRLEFKHFRRHVMNNTLLHADEIEGWRGEIRDSKVVKDHETALREEREEEEGEEAREEAPEEAAEAAEEAPEEAAEEGAEEAAEEEPEEEEAPEELEEEEEEEEGEEEPEEEEERERAPARAEAGGRARARVVTRRRAPEREAGEQEPEERRTTRTRGARTAEPARRGARTPARRRAESAAERGEGEQERGAEEAGEPEQPARRPVRRRRPQE